VITVLFACVQNAGRSQIAAALFNKHADPGKAHAISAGTRPADRVHPEVIDVMRSRGLDVSSQRPQRLTPELARTANWLITMGCGDECPIVPGVQRDDWPILDPQGQSTNTVTAIVGDIEARVRQLIEARGLAKSVTA
jgi:arsenate reductase